LSVKSGCIVGGEQSLQSWPSTPIEQWQRRTDESPERRGESLSSQRFLEPLVSLIAAEELVPAVTR